MLKINRFTSIFYQPKNYLRLIFQCVNQWAWPPISFCVCGFFFFWQYTIEEHSLHTPWGSVSVQRQEICHSCTALISHRRARAHRTSKNLSSQPVLWSTDCCIHKVPLLLGMGSLITYVLVKTKTRIWAIFAIYSIASHSYVVILIT